MYTTLWEQSLAHFREVTASAAPTPGGGSVALVSGTFGLGLVIMALEITQRKRPPEETEDIQRTLHQARELLTTLSRGADEDVMVFEQYMASLRLPKATPEEKTARKEAMQAALKGATLAPLSAAIACVQALQLAERSCPLVDRHVISDVGAGAALLGGAVTAVLLNVDINLPSLADESLRTSYGQQRVQLQTDSAAITARVLARVHQSLTPAK